MESLCRKMYRWVVKLATYLQVPSDKLLHFLCSAAITLLCSLVMGKAAAVIVTCAVCIAKETYDCFKKNPTGWSWGDLLADLLGILVVL